MATSFESIVQKALLLTAEERLRLAAELMQSVRAGAGEGVQEAWEQEIERRIAEIDSGKAQGRTWSEIKKDFDSRYSG